MKNCIKKHPCDDKRKDEIYEIKYFIVCYIFYKSDLCRRQKIFTADKKLLFYSN